MPTGKFIRTKEYREKMSSVMKGKEKTPEHIEKVKNALKVGYASGKLKVSEERKSKISKANKGRKRTVDICEKLSSILKEQYRKGKKSYFSSIEFKSSQSDRIKNLWKNFKYREYMSKVHRLDESKIICQLRNHYQYRQWRNNIFIRDDFTCHNCIKRGGYLEAHHLTKFSDIFYKGNIKSLEEGLKYSKLWDMNNGITLCVSCHKETDNYGNRMTITQA